MSDVMAEKIKKLDAFWYLDDQGNQITRNEFLADLWGGMPGWMFCWDYGVWAAVLGWNESEADEALEEWLRENRPSEFEREQEPDYDPDFESWPFTTELHIGKIPERHMPEGAKFKWSSAYEWAINKARSHRGDAPFRSPIGHLYSMVVDLLGEADNDTIQGLFEKEMDDDGFFVPVMD